MLPARTALSALLTLWLSLSINCIQAQIQHAPDRKEGNGPFNQCIIRGVTLIDGTGAPPFGPVDIILEGNRIARIDRVGYPGVPIDSADRVKLKPGGYELHAEGMYALPGFIDLHGHIGGTAKDVTAEYVYKLWMAHGITTIRDPGSGHGVDWVVEEKKRSADNKITAPRINTLTYFGAG